jgi:hypothetical protein
MNLGLSSELKAQFPDIKPILSLAKANNAAFAINEPKSGTIADYIIPDPNWVAGFSSGEACFMVDINKSTSNKIGLAYATVNLRFIISQHGKDVLLLLSLINFFNCGQIYKNKDCFNLTIRKFAD